MKTREAFAHFDRTLAGEHKARIEEEVELGFAEAPKHRGGRPRGTGRPRNAPPLQEEPPPKLNKEGKVETTFYANPRFTASAALTAAREGTTTKAVMERWITTLAYADDPPPSPVDPQVTFTMHLAVGPDAFPEDLFADLCKCADEMGVTPSRLATGIVKQALAERWMDDPNFGKRHAPA